MRKCSPACETRNTVTRNWWQSTFFTHCSPADNKLVKQTTNCLLNVLNKLSTIDNLSRDSKRKMVTASQQTQRARHAWMMGGSPSDGIRIVWALALVYVCVCMCVCDLEINKY